MFPPSLPPLAPLPPAVDPATADYVRIRRVTSTSTGSIGGRQFVFSGWSAPIAVAIKGVKRLIGGGFDSRTQMREHMVVQYEVTFDDEPLVGLRDQLSWDSAGKILTVTGVMPVGNPDNRTWTVLAEEDVA